MLTRELTGCVGCAIPTPRRFWLLLSHFVKASCFHANGTWDTNGCTFNQFAGELWTARSHQYLLANGIAVVQLNPYTDDTWEWGDPSIPDGTGVFSSYFVIHHCRAASPTAMLRVSPWCTH